LFFSDWWTSFLAILQVFMDSKARDWVVLTRYTNKQHICNLINMVAGS
jgi:hypothetical protein